ncbi:hypothetical protein OF385_06425 [Glutamicibacter sp. JL.03c]|uniref:hypothetical protein n=1 Tax=Glutamicibacter sp. JL.03c TaxID=2984842 RepID=UPI0021F70DAF|nr:hypothetical protein [Glutamicibacter sp. JL.03c]UYQ78774.1 hypothetical protein OF385_06425 [Glutamicibacter sp. JL.03c]
MGNFPASYECLKYHLSELGEFSVLPPNDRGAAFLKYAETGVLYAFDRDFSGVMDMVMLTDGESLWPDMDALQAKMSLFSVHVHETVELAADGDCILYWGKDGLRSKHGSLPRAVISETPLIP